MYRGRSVGSASYGPGPYSRSMRGSASMRSRGRSLGSPSMRGRSLGSSRSMGASRSMGTSRPVSRPSRSMGKSVRSARSNMRRLPTRRYKKDNTCCVYTAVVLLAIIAIVVIFRCQIVQKLELDAEFLLNNESWLFCDTCSLFPNFTACSDCYNNHIRYDCQSATSMNCVQVGVPHVECTCERDPTLPGCNQKECTALFTREEALDRLSNVVGKICEVKNGVYPMFNDPVTGSTYRIDHFGGITSYIWGLPADNDGLTGGANTSFLATKYFDQCTKDQLKPGDILLAFGYDIVFRDWAASDKSQYHMTYCSTGSEKVVEFTQTYPHQLFTEIGEYYVAADLIPYCIKDECYKK